MLAYDASRGLHVADWTEGRLLTIYATHQVKEAMLFALTQALLTGHNIGVFYAWSKRLVVLYRNDQPATENEELPW